MRYNEVKMEIWNSDQNMIAADPAMSDCYDGPRNLAVDLGAHVGTRSIWLATDGGFKTVYAVEMELENYMLLCRNIDRNKLWNAIIPVLAAVSDRNEMCAIRSGNGNRGQFSLAYDVPAFAKRPGRIMTVPLREFILAIASEIDFMKMDIEGGEYAIFNDLRSKAAIRNWVRFIFLERHGPNTDYFSDEFFEEKGYDPKNPQKKLFEHLNQCGFLDIRENTYGQLMAYNSYMKHQTKAA